MTYLVAAMLAWVPLYAHPKTESPDDVRARYESIARDISAIALDASEAPLFEGPDGRTETAMLMASVASFESAYRKKVDDGTQRGDGGRSFCVMQIRVGGGETHEGWTGPDLIQDRKKCLRAALHMLQRSFHSCRGLPVEDRLSVYATGHCMRDASISRSRLVRARNWWSTHILPRVAPEGSEVAGSSAAPVEGAQRAIPTGS